MPDPTVYQITERQKEDYRRAFAGIKLSEDILKKFRLAGEPKVDQEARLDAMKERVLRFASAFGVDLPDLET